MKLHLYILLGLLIGSLRTNAQESGSVFNFMSLSSSAHANALGGKNISLTEDDASLILQNPSLMSNVSDKSINLNFTTYMQGSKLGSAAFVKTVGERGTWGATAQFVGYGKMIETTETGEVLGNMHALDMVLSGMYCHDLGEGWVGGAAGKFIYSKYASYTSIGLGVDLSINYYNESIGFSTSMVAANLGGQIKAFGDVHEKLPFNLQWGFTKSIAHAPIRVSVTLVDLTRWSKSYYYNNGSDPKFGKILLNHIDIGIDVIPSERFYIALGYNFRRGSELKAAGSSHMAGLTAGAGMQLKKIKFGIAYAKYHISAPSLSFSLGYSL